MAVLYFPDHIGLQHGTEKMFCSVKGSGLKKPRAKLIEDVNSVL